MNAAKFSPRIFTFRRSWNQLFYRRTPQLEFSIWCIYCKTASCCKPFFKSVSSVNLLNEFSSVQFSCSINPIPTSLARQWDVWARLGASWHPGSFSRLLAAPGSSWKLLAIPGSSWQLQIVPGSPRSCPGASNRARELRIVPGSSKSCPGASNRARELQIVPGSFKSCP